MQTVLTLGIFAHHIPAAFCVLVCNCYRRNEESLHTSVDMISDKTVDLGLQPVSLPREAKRYSPCTDSILSWKHSQRKQFAPM